MSLSGTERLPEYYQHYIRESGDKSLADALKQHLRGFDTLMRHRPDADWDFAYAPGKWRIRDLLQHVLDSERIFSYRVLCIARGEQSNLPYFDENLYAENALKLNRQPSAILEELNVLDSATRILFESFGPEQLAARGIANNIEVSVEEIGRIMIGHANHHQRILRERYMVNLPL